jgi:MOSC domain-containing protein YiiM
VVQVNISPGGVPKRPIASAHVGPLGVEGDDHAHPKYHGGPSKAVLLIASELIDQLAAEGFPVFYGALGENFTTRGLDPRQWRTGQRFRMPGGLILELTTVRVPCSTLDIYRHPNGRPIQQEIYDKVVKAGDPSSPKWALSGFYASVVQPGPVEPGVPIVLLDQVV